MSGSDPTEQVAQVCQDCWEYLDDAPLCICRATYDPCPHCGRHVFTTPREKHDGAIPINCPCRNG